MSFKPYTDYQYLYDRYVVKGWTIDKIAQECGCGKSTIDRYLDKLGIKKKGRR